MNLCLAQVQKKIFVTSPGTNKLAQAQISCASVTCARPKSLVTCASEKEAQATEYLYGTRDVVGYRLIMMRLSMFQESNKSRKSATQFIIRAAAGGSIGPHGSIGI